MPPTISLLSSHEIDPIRWNALVQQSNNGYVYAQYEYLNLFSTQWVAWVEQDYRFAWPLIGNRKWGIHYLYQPYFLAQLGAMSVSDGEDFEQKIRNCWRHLPKKYLYADIDLPEDHRVLSELSRGMYRQTMILPLEQGAATVRMGYHRLARRMIQRALQSQVQVAQGLDIEQDLLFYQSMVGLQMRTHAAGYERFLNVLVHAQQCGQLLHLRATVDDQLAGVYFLLYSDRYMHSVAGCASPLGKELGAFYALTDAAIVYGAAHSAVFRFEGSDIPGIAAFNRRFGAQAVSYWHIKGWRF